MAGHRDDVGRAEPAGKLGPGHGRPETHLVRDAQLGRERLQFAQGAHASTRPAEKHECRDGVAARAHLRGGFDEDVGAFERLDAAREQHDWAVGQPEPGALEANDDVVRERLGVSHDVRVREQVGVQVRICDTRARAGLGQIGDRRGVEEVEVNPGGHDVHARGVGAVHVDQFVCLGSR